MHFIYKPMDNNLPFQVGIIPGFDFIGRRCINSHLVGLPSRSCGFLFRCLRFEYEDININIPFSFSGKLTAVFQYDGLVGESIEFHGISFWRKVHISDMKWLHSRNISWFILLRKNINFVDHMAQRESSNVLTILSQFEKFSTFWETMFKWISYNRKYKKLN